ncbi:hypothetical protein Nwi_1741 [Nitrobacter winogradskyi Nb-255]|uniref:Uncharacterized protein n=1 Tax=Nitrobacter winogradskyi (strain ATCC 25391 / DSM 10237 / CIP 104748 / NCIMB 11846 / Nb-255) TaxID=323098 RepID=Q3SRT9_NITWN|nr:hypothetical protein Nwi_1741 [Nitrobacter winogradskyi Nb-255]
MKKTRRVEAAQWRSGCGIHFTRKRYNVLAAFAMLSCPRFARLINETSNRTKDPLSSSLDCADPGLSGRPADACRAPARFSDRTGGHVPLFAPERATER